MIGAAASVDSEDSTVAPRKAPIAPGPAIRATTRQSTFFSLQWEMPGGDVGAELGEVHRCRGGRRGEAGQQQQASVDVTP